MTLARDLLQRCERLLDGAARFCLYTRAALTPLSEVRKGVIASWNDFIPDERDIGAGLAWWERDVADRYVKRHDRVLVIGCGSGRDLASLVERGCTVTGIDPAPRALARAAGYLEAQGGTATLECAFFEDWPRDDLFDVVWFSWFVYGYVPDSRRRIAMLKKAGRNLSPGGVLVLSYPINPPGSRAASLARAAQRLWRNDWALEEGDVIGRLRNTGLFSYEHRFTREEIERETRAAGFYVEWLGEPIVVLRAAAAVDATHARTGDQRRVASVSVRP